MRLGARPQRRCAVALAAGSEAGGHLRSDPRLRRRTKAQRRHPRTAPRQSRERAACSIRRWRRSIHSIAASMSTSAGMHPALQKLFAPQVQDFLIDTFRHDPAKLAVGAEGAAADRPGGARPAGFDRRRQGARRGAAQSEAGPGPAHEPRAEGRRQRRSGRRISRPMPIRRCRSTAPWSKRSPPS